LNIDWIICRDLFNAIGQVAVGIMRSFQQASQQISKSSFAVLQITILKEKNIVFVRN